MKKKCPFKVQMNGGIGSCRDIEDWCGMFLLLTLVLMTYNDGWGPTFIDCKRDNDERGPNPKGNNHLENCFNLWKILSMS